MASSSSSVLPHHHSLVSNGDGRLFSQGIRILVVDSDLASLTSIEEKCHHHYYDVITKSQANDALSALARREQVDVILYEKNMPTVNGVELIRFLRTQLPNMAYPVLLMSADHSVDSVADAFKAGADGFVEKPVSDDEIKKIWHYIARKRSAMVPR